MINAYSDIKKNGLSFVMITSALGGVLYVLGFPSFVGVQLFLAPSLGVSLLLLNLDLRLSCPSTTFYRQLLPIIIFSIFFGIIGLYWIPRSAETVGFSPPFNYLLLMFYSLISAPQYISFFLLLTLGRYLSARISGHTSRYQNIFLHLRSLSSRNLLLALLLTLCEYWTPTAVPTYIGHGYMQLAPYLGLANYGGEIIFSFFAFWLSFIIVGYLKEKRIDLMGTIFFLLFLAINFILPLKYAPTTADPVNHIRLVQANVDSLLKDSAKKGVRQAYEQVFATYYQLSYPLSAKLNGTPPAPVDPPIDLIIWPETAYPFSLSLGSMIKDPTTIPKWPLYISSLIKTDIFFGGYVNNDKKNSKNKPTGSTGSTELTELTESDELSQYEQTYNSVFFLQYPEKIQGVYNKHLLIPFGETLPFGGISYRVFNKLLPEMGFFARGDSFPTFSTKNNTQFVSVICYEIIFSEFVRKVLNQAQAASNLPAHFLVNVSNDSWSNTLTEQEQHLFLARWRAIEHNLPIIRSTNTGISTIIYPDGSLGPTIPINTTGQLTIKIATPYRIPTFFQRWGVAVTVIFALVALATSVILVTLVINPTRRSIN
ncbi:MAG: apolipoprotein N-acyltransferase [Oligoflexia bacterium]|nr:apolipoprotein N-acyltransferase [Oligoflexia bacterium]